MTFSEKIKSLERHKSNFRRELNWLSIAECYMMGLKIVDEALHGRLKGTMDDPSYSRGTFINFWDAVTFEWRNPNAKSCY